MVMLKEIVEFGKNFDFKIRRYDRKSSYEGLVYESVDDI